MLTARRLSVRRGGREFASLESFDARDGDVVGVVGRSGVGKSTLLEILAGSLPVNGALELDGEDFGENRRRKLALRTLQNFPLFHWHTARSLLHLATSIRGGEAVGDAMAALKNAEAGHLADRYPTEMSGGERARVTLALAWALDVRLLLLDEPFNGLDPITRVIIGERLFSRFKGRAMIVLYVTHNLDDVVKYANRCLVFSGSKIIEADPKDEQAMLRHMQ